MNKENYEMALKVLDHLERSHTMPYLIAGIGYAKEAVKKQIPRKPQFMQGGKDSFFALRCPNCESVLQADSPCCKYCGQTLEWR